MYTKQGIITKDVCARISQLERRFTMDWYSKEQLLEDLYKLRETIRTLARKHEEIKDCLSDYNKKIDLLVDQIH